MELMNCGLCGGEPKDAQIFGYQIECSICGACGPFNCKSKSAAENRWNDLQTKLARLVYLEAMLQSDAPKQTKGRL